MRINQTVRAALVVASFAALTLTAPPGASAMCPSGATCSSGTRPGPQGPCSPGGIWHPDRPGSTAGWCEYPKKKNK